MKLILIIYIVAVFGGLGFVQWVIKAHPEMSPYASNFSPNCVTEKQISDKVIDQLTRKATIAKREGQPLTREQLEQISITLFKAHKQNLQSTGMYCNDGT